MPFRVSSISLQIETADDIEMLSKNAMSRISKTLVVSDIH